jgi:hypothetical protein
LSECVCLMCEKAEPVWGSFLCAPCKQALEHPETTRPPFDRGKPVSKRVAQPRPTLAQRPKAPGNL